MNYIEKENIILDKTYNYAIRIVKLYQYLCKEKKKLNCLDRFYVVERLLVQMSKNQLEDFPKNIFWLN